MKNILKTLFLSLALIAGANSYSMSQQVYRGPAMQPGQGMMMQQQPMMQQQAPVQRPMRTQQRIMDPTQCPMYQR
ncbi:MAG: hypothetical protein ACD_20C00410G0023 [uncultured bacterium]|nr:MAG: hypothetical protein ACD_20C00410G0023 [uncultured bacterium]